MQQSWAVSPCGSCWVQVTLLLLPLGITSGIFIIHMCIKLALMLHFPVYRIRSDCVLGRAAGVAFEFEQQLPGHRLLP